MTPPSRGDAVWWLCAAFAVVGTVVLLVGLTLGFALPGASSPLDGSSATPGENGSDHENPSTLDDGEDLRALEQQLRSSVVSQAQSGALNLTQEDYEQARDQLGGEQFNRLLEEYQGVAAETGSTNQSATLAESQAALVSVSREVTAYWELYGAYQRLTEPGSGFENFDFVAARQSPETVLREFNATTRRELVADLEQRAENVEQAAAVATANYQELSESTGENYTATVESIRNSRDRITETQQPIRQAWYTETELTLSADSVSISAVDPLRTAGRLTEPDGTPIANERVNLSVGEQSMLLRTNETGGFYLEYYPTAIASNTTELTVRYTPSTASQHLDSEATVNVTIEQVDPTLQVEPSPAETRFNGTVAVTGQIEAGGAALPGLPYLVSVDGRFVAQGTTGSDGRIDTAFTVPAEVDAGQQQVRVSLPLDGRAVRPAEETSPIEITTTPTVVTLNTTDAGGETIRIDGALQTADGTPVSNQSLQVVIDDRAVGTTLTDRNGSFGTTVTVPTESFSGGDEQVPVRVRTVFDSAGTNLASDDSELSVTVPNPGTGSGLPSLDGGSTNALAVVGGVLLVVFGVGLLSWFRRRERRPASQAAGGADGADSGGSEPTVGAPPVEDAVELLDAGRPEAAVRAGYATLRRTVAGDDNASRRQTHWEFYDHQCQRLDAETARRLRTVTEAYERVTFANEPADTDLAGEVVDAVQSITERTASGESSPLAGD